MKGKVKILSLLLAVAMVSSMFVACKGEDKPAASSKPTASTDGSSEVVKKDPVKLVWYHWGDTPKKPDAVIAELNKMSMEDIQTEIDFRFTTGDDQKLKTLMSTGGEFDIAFTCSWFANYVISAQGGQLADITDKVKTVTPKLYEYIPEMVWEGSKVNGKIYAVPTYKDTAAAQYWTVNKEYVIDGAKAEAELKATGKKLSTVTPLLEKVKAYADAGNPYPNNTKAAFNYNWAGLNGYNNGWDSLGVDALRVGVKIDGGDTKVVPQWEDPEMIEDFKTLKSWMDKGLVNKDAMTTEKEFEFIVVGTAQGWDGAEAIWGKGKPYTVAINKKYGPVYTTSGIQGSMNGISPNSKNIDRALQYLEYVNTDKDYRNTLGYGIKDTNWKVTDAGNAENLNDDWAPGMFSQGSFFELYPLAPAPADMYTNLKAANDSAAASVLVGFVPVTESIKNEIAACDTIIQKYYKSLQTGDCKDVDATLAKGLKELRSAGYDKIIAELQKQVDAFVAAK